MPQIRWDANELKAIAQKAAEIRAVTMDNDMLSLTRQAQIVLPPNRRRKLLQKQALNGTLIELIEATSKNTIFPEAPAAETPVPLPSPTINNQLEEFFIRILVGAAQRLAGDPLIQKLFNGQVQEAAAVIATVDSNHKKHNPEMVQQNGVRKPIILIVGLKPHQRAIFESTFRDFTFKFWYDESRQLLHDKALGAARILVALEEASSHGAVQTITAAKRNAQMIRVSGGQSSLLEAMNELRRQNDRGAL